MIRTDGFIIAISRAPTTPRVSGVSGVCSVMKSHRGHKSSSRAALSTPDSRAFSAERNGSKPSTVIPNARARTATARPTRPSPTTPRTLPASCVPVNLLRSHLPDLTLSLARGTLRARDSKRARVCSAVETVLPPGVFITTIPRRVAAATSILSTPTPARTMALSRGWPSRISAVSCVPERMTIPSALSSACRRPAVSCASLVLTMTSMLGSAQG